MTFTHWLLTRSTRACLECAPALTALILAAAVCGTHAIGSPPGDRPDDCMLRDTQGGQVEGLRDREPVEDDSAGAENDDEPGMSHQRRRAHG